VPRRHFQELALANELRIAAVGEPSTSPLIFMLLTDF
jgi:hypothetical protein